MISYGQRISQSAVYEVFASASANTFISGSPYTVLIPDKFNQQTVYSSSMIVEAGNTWVKYIGGTSGSIDLQNTSSWKPLSGINIYSSGSTYPSMSLVSYSSSYYITTVGSSLPPLNSTKSLNTGWTQSPLWGLQRLRGNISNYFTNKIASGSLQYNWLQSVSGEPSWDNQSGWPISSPNIYYDNVWFYHVDNGVSQSVILNSLLTSNTKSPKYDITKSLDVVYKHEILGVTTYETSSYRGECVDKMTYYFHIGGTEPLFVSCSLTFGITVNEETSMSFDNAGYDDMFEPERFYVDGFTTTTVTTASINLNNYVRTTFPSWFNSSSYVLQSSSSVGGGNGDFRQILYNYRINISQSISPDDYQFVFEKTGSANNNDIVNVSWNGSQWNAVVYYPPKVTFANLLGGNISSSLFATASVFTKGIHNNANIKKISVSGLNTGSNRTPPFTVFDNYTYNSVANATASSGFSYGNPLIGISGIDACLPSEGKAVQTTFVNSGSTYTLAYNYNPSTTGYWFAKIPPIAKLNLMDMRNLPHNLYVTEDGRPIDSSRTPPLQPLHRQCFYYFTGTPATYFEKVYSYYEMILCVPRWNALTYYPVGAKITDSFGNIQECVSASVSDGAEPGTVYGGAPYNTWNESGSSYTTESRISGYFTSSLSWSTGSQLIWKKIYDRKADMTSGYSGIYYNPTTSSIFHPAYYPNISDTQTRNASTVYLEGQLIKDDNGEIRKCYVGGTTSSGSVSWGSGSGTYGYGQIGQNVYTTDGTVTWSPYMAGMNVIGNWIYKVYAERCADSGSINYELGYYKSGSIWTSLMTGSTGNIYNGMYPILTNTPLVYKADEPIRIEATVIGNQTGSWSTPELPVTSIWFKDIQNILPVIT
jgi:hypothetical protein